MSSSSSEPSSSSNSGRTGGGSYRFNNLFQSIEEKNGCYFICAQFLAPNLFLGSLYNRPDIKFFAFSLTFLGNLSFPSFIFLYKVGISSEK